MTAGGCASDTAPATSLALLSSAGAAGETRSTMSGVLKLNVTGLQAVSAEAVVGLTVTSGAENVYGERTAATTLTGAAGAVKTTAGAAVETTGAGLTCVAAVGAATGVAGKRLKVGRLDRGSLASGSSGGIISCVS